jgi:hypothetical protein
MAPLVDTAFTGAGTGTRHRTGVESPVRTYPNEANPSV